MSSPTSPFTADQPWSDVTGLGHPPPLIQPAVTYDASDGYLLLFGGVVEYSLGGGAASSFNSNYTYGFDSQDNVWTNLTTAVAPPASDSWSIAYDPHDGYVVAFGGAGTETWSFHAGKWSELFPSTAPSARYSPCMSYDSEDGYVVLFGGDQWYGGFVPLADTWSFVAGAWTNITPLTSPPGGQGCLLQDDPALGALIQFGGGYSTNETWSFTHGTWTRLAPITVPGTRFNAMLAYLAPSEAVVMFGGFEHVGAAEGELGDTWMFVGDNWYRVSTSPSPAARGGDAGAFDPTDQRIVMYGGILAGVGGQVSTDTWTLGDPLGLARAPSTPTAWDVGVLGRLAVVASGGASPISYSWNSIPPGCVSVSVTEQQCLVTTAGVYPTSIAATDAEHFQAFAEFNVTYVASPEVFVGLSVNATDVGFPVRANASVIGGVGVPSWTWGGLVASLGCPSPTDVGRGSWANCTPVSPGAYPLAVAATDAINVTVNSSVLSLLVAALPEISSAVAEPSNPTSGQALTIQLALTGGTAPFAYTYLGLPPGCAAQSSATLSCAPTSSGSYSITVTATDAVGATAHRTVNVTVAAPPGVGAFLSSPTLWVAVAVGVAVVAGLGWMVQRRRRSAKSPRAARPPSGGKVRGSGPAIGR